MSYLCLRTKKDSSGRQLRDRYGYLINFEDGVLLSRCYIPHCRNGHDEDYYHGPVPCNLTFGAERNCHNSACPRFHFRKDVKDMVKYLEAFPKKLLNFLEIFTPEQFKFIMSIEEQKHYYQNLKMRRIYKPDDFMPFQAPPPAPVPVPAPMPAPMLAPLMPDMAKMFESFMQQQFMNNFMATMTGTSITGMPSFIPGISQSSQIPFPPPQIQTSSHYVIPPLPPPPEGYVPSNAHVSDAARRMILHGIRSATEIAPPSEPVRQPMPNPSPSPRPNPRHSQNPSLESGEVSSASGNWYFDNRDMRVARVTVVRRSEVSERNPRERSRSRERKSFK